MTEGNPTQTTQKVTPFHVLQNGNKNSKTYDPKQK